MDKCREAFERFECEKYECNYDDMKKNWDWYESQFGYRYSPDSLRGKDWAIWQKAWQHQQAKVEELQERVDKALQEIKGAARWIDEDAIDDPNFIKGGVLSALRRLEQALKGEA